MNVYELLEENYRRYHRLDFIEDDPIQIPHFFQRKEDIEIAGFIAATIAWGKRAMIIRNAKRWMQIMDNAPYDFVMNAEEKDLKPLLHFVHRTFNGDDALFFMTSLQNIYRNHGGLEAVFAGGLQKGLEEADKFSPMFTALNHFRAVFMDSPHLERSGKHLANPAKGSAAKRLNMYLRWMCRQDKQAVDFGIWKSIAPKYLMMPLDVHTGRMGRKLGLLRRKADDWKAVEQLTAALRQFDDDDPVKYDFALFGMGLSGV